MKKEGELICCGCGKALGNVYWGMLAVTTEEKMLQDKIDKTFSHWKETYCRPAQSLFLSPLFAAMDRDICLPSSGDGKLLL